jgi:hypothetical protein
MSDGCPRDSYEIFDLVFQEVIITLGGLKSMSSTSETAASVPGNPWWIVLVEGIIALIFGILLITAPGATSVPGYRVGVLLAYSRHFLDHRDLHS